MLNSGINSAVFPNFFRRQRCDNLGRNLRFLQNDRAQISSERSFNRADKFWIDIQLCHQRAGQARLNSLGILEPFQHCPRTFCQTFAFFVQLLQDIETRFLLGERAFDPDQTFLRLREQLSTLL